MCSLYQAASYEHSFILLGWLLSELAYLSKLCTVSTRLDAHLMYARNPLFGPMVVVKYDVTQLESCLSISLIPLFALNLVRNVLRVYARGYSDTCQHEINRKQRICRNFKHTSLILQKRICFCSSSNSASSSGSMYISRIICCNIVEAETYKKTEGH